MAISSIPLFVSRILEIRDKWSPKAKYPEIWYRGICDGSLPLLPGSYWRPDCDEQSLVLSFRSMVPSFISSQASYISAQDPARKTGLLYMTGQLD